MGQQQAQFDQRHAESASYSAGYEEAPHYKNYSTDVHGQKLFPREDLMRVTAGQRLILAIVSLSMVFLMFLTVVILVTSSALSPSMADSFAPVFVVMSLGLLAAVIVVNVVFNRSAK